MQRTKTRKKSSQHSTPRQAFLGAVCFLFLKPAARPKQKHRATKKRPPKKRAGHRQSIRGPNHKKVNRRKTPRETKRKLHTRAKSQLDKKIAGRYSKSVPKPLPLNRASVVSLSSPPRPSIVQVLFLCRAPPRPSIVQDAPSQSPQSIKAKSPKSIRGRKNHPIYNKKVFSYSKKKCCDAINHPTARIRFNRRAYRSHQNSCQDCTLCQAFLGVVCIFVRKCNA